MSLGPMRIKAAQNSLKKATNFASKTKRVNETSGQIKKLAAARISKAQSLRTARKVCKGKDASGKCLGLTRAKMKAKQTVSFAKKSTPGGIGGAPSLSKRSAF